MVSISIGNMSSDKTINKEGFNQSSKTDNINKINVKENNFSYYNLLI